MATTDLENKVVVESGIWNCSICLEEFKTPKYLQCLHTFCQTCLQSYFVSSPKIGKTPPDHFNCPLCREEVKPPDPTLPVEKWATSMPGNHMINTLMEASSKSSEMPSQTNDCDPCKYDGESITGEFWCFECREFLCGKCRKDHLRQKVLRNHKVVPASDVPQQDIDMTLKDVEEPCMDHQGELLKVYCVDHQKMCCVLCLSINHRKCGNIKTFDEMAEGMKNKGEIEHFSDKMKEIDSKVDKIVARKRDNITSIQDQHVTILNKADDLIQKAKDKLDKCHQEFKDRVAITHKEYKNKLIDAAERIENYQKSLTNFQKIWKAVLVSGTPKQIFVTFEKIKERIETQGIALEEYFQGDEIISYEVTFNKLAANITTFTSIAQIKVKTTPCDQSLVLDISGILTTDKDVDNLQPEVDLASVDDIELVKMFDIREDRRYFTCGMFLKENKLLLVHFSSKTLNVYDSSGKREICQSVPYSPLGAAQHSDQNIYVLSNFDTNIRVYTLVSDYFKERNSIKTDIPFSKYIYSLCITQDNHILAECGHTIHLMTMDGKTKRTINRSEGYSCIASSSSDKGSVLYYCDVGPEVISESIDGEELMRYKIPDIKTPRGIAVDNVGNVYVCGEDSRNVCVVSKDGKSSRVLMSKLKCDTYRQSIAIGFDRSGTKFFETGFNNGTPAVYTFRNRQQ